MLWQVAEKRFSSLSHPSAKSGPAEGVFQQLTDVTIERSRMDVDLQSGTATSSYATLLLVCCAIAFGGYVGSHMRVPILPLFARNLGATTVEVGIINATYLVVAGILSLPLGILSDRIGRKRLASFGAFILAAVSFLLAFSRTPAELVWIYLLFGIGLAAFGPTMMSMVADLSPATHLGRSYGWYTMALYGAMSFGPAFGGLVAEEWGFRPVFVASGVIILSTFWMVLVFLPRSRRDVARRTRTKSRVVLARELVRNRPLMGCWLATFGGCFGLGMFVTFLPLHAHNRNLTAGQIGLVFAVQGLCNALSRIPFGHLSDRANSRERLVLFGLLGFSVSLVGFALSERTWQFDWWAAMFGISMSLAFTSVAALIAEAVPPELRGLAMGGYNTSIYFGMMVSSALMGGVIERAGFEAGFVLAALVNLGLTGLFHLLMKDFSRPSS
jgi:MFS family permease